MRNLIAYIVLSIGVMPAFSVPVSAQESNAEHGFRVHLGWDASVTTFSEIHDDGSNQLSSFSGFSLGLSYDFPIGLNPIIQISGHTINQPLAGMVSNSQAWYFMGGFFLKNTNQPVYVNLLAGMNRHMYDFDGSGLDFFYEDFEKFAVEIEIGYEKLIFNNIPVRFSAGTRDAFDTGAKLDNLFLKIGTSYFINLSR